MKLTIAFLLLAGGAAAQDRDDYRVFQRLDQVESRVDYIEQRQRAFEKRQLEIADEADKRIQAIRSELNALIDREFGATPVAVFEKPNVAARRVIVYAPDWCTACKSIPHYPDWEFVKTDIPDWVQSFPTIAYDVGRGDAGSWYQTAEPWQGIERFRRVVAYSAADNDGPPTERISLTKSEQVKRANVIWRHDVGLHGATGRMYPFCQACQQ